MCCESVKRVLGRLKAGLFVSTAFVALGGMTSVQTVAQQAAQPQTTDELVIYGYELQALRAIEAKRESDNVVDSVAEDEIGRLPDFNAGEALRRLPGVSVENDQAEGRFVTIRGLDASFNLTTIDGTLIASPDRDGREIFMDVLPASLAQRIEVIKTNTPDMDANAIGGTINFVTRSPFDFDDGFLSMVGSIGAYETTGDGYRDSGPSGDARVIYSKKFSDKFAAIFQANYYKRDSFISTAETGDEVLFYSPDVNGAFTNNGGPGAAGGNTLKTRNHRAEDAATGDKVFFEPGHYRLPEERKWLWYHNDRTRYGGSAKFEYKPTDRWTSKLNLFYSTSEDDEARMETKIWNRRNGAEITFDSPVSGRLENTEFTTQLGQFDFERTTWGAGLENEFKIDDKNKLYFKGAYSGAYFRNDEWFTRFKQTKADFHYDWSGDYPTFTPSLGDALKLSNFDFEKDELNYRQLDETLYTFKLDYGHNNEKHHRGLGFKLGGKMRHNDRTFDEGRDRWSYGDGLTLANVDTSYVCPEGMAGCVANDFILMNVDSVDKLRNDYRDSANTSFNEQTDTDNNNDYSAEEKVYAGFGMMTYTADQARFIVGLRNEFTEFNSQGRNKRDGVWEDASNEGEYNHLLPSGLLSLQLNDDVVLRVGASQTISRPAFSQFAVRGETLRYDSNNNEVVGRRNNPDLKPRTSTNYDASLEWYMDSTSLFSIGVFRKDVKNQIYTGSFDGVIDFDTDGDGSVESGIQASISQPLNSAAGRLSGIELNLQKSLNFLPAPFDGVTLALNATFVDGKMDVLMSDGSLRELDTFYKQADTTFNAALLYNKGPWEGRLAYHYRSEMLNKIKTNAADIYREEYDAARGQLDLQARYNFTDKMGVYVNALNLTGERREEVYGFDQDVQRVTSSRDRAVFLGFSWRN